MSEGFFLGLRTLSEGLGRRTLSDGLKKPSYAVFPLTVLVNTGVKFYLDDSMDLLIKRRRNI